MTIASGNNCTVDDVLDKDIQWVKYAYLSALNVQLERVKPLMWMLGVKFEDLKELRFSMDAKENKENARPNLDINMLSKMGIKYKKGK